MKDPLGFSVSYGNPRVQRAALSGDLYRAALAFVRGDIEVQGDLYEAIGFFTGRAGRGWRPAIGRWLARAAAWRPEAWWQSRRRAASNVRCHYDRSNEFFRQFLDRGMTYSCAYFKSAGCGLDEAQQAKLEHILAKLDLGPGERFLDIGCGWGALVELASRRGARATGCTLSRAQYDWARARLAEAGAEVLESDYRDLAGQWDKIASVGMFEHVGRRRLTGYFRKVRALLAPGGLFLNHGLVRPQTLREGVETLFLRRMIFPGTELPHLGELIRACEEAGLEVLDVENLRPHYALTCRAWVRRLMDNGDACVRHAGRETHRAWLLYLASCALQFEAAQLDVYQILLAARAQPLPRRLTRDYMYGGASARYPADVNNRV